MTMPVNDAPRATRPVASLRASHADREATSSMIQAAAGAGMLSVGETEERLSAVNSARFRHELAPLVADLPTQEGRLGPRAGRDTVANAGRQVVAALVVLCSALLALAGRHRRLSVLAALAAAAVLALVVGLGADLLGGENHGAETGAGMMEGR